MLIYHSNRRMGDFALGLFLNCLDHHNPKADIQISQFNERRLHSAF
ncbi:hypothetical protein GVN22_16775 [Cellulophaga sp. BC115SP]|nr:hypothetical protein [Cellulophaga sp. BC115SP]